MALETWSTNKITNSRPESHYRNLNKSQFGRTFRRLDNFFFNKQLIFLEFALAKLGKVPQKVV